MLNQKPANIQERKVLKNGTVLYTVGSSSSDYTYFITVKNGVIDVDTHQDCRGFHFCGHCFHIRDINAMESEIAAEKKMVAHQAAMTEQYASDPRPTEWVTMPNGTQRLASQVNDACLNSLDKMSEAYSKMQREWEARPPYKPQGLEETYSAGWYPKSSRY